MPVRPNPTRTTIARQATKRPVSAALIPEPPLLVLPSLAKAIGLNEAIVLQQIHYWISNPKVGKLHEGKRWVRNTVKEWQEDNFPFMSASTIRRAIESLVKMKLVEAKNLNEQGYDQTLWYTILYTSILSEWTNGFAQDDNIDLSNLSKPIPETTSETTQEGIASNAVPLQIETPKPKRQPTVKASNGNTPPGSAPPPKTVQPHIAIIDAWLAALPAKPMVKDVYGRYSTAAVPMAKAGIQPDDVTRYVKELRKEQFWRGKLIGLEYVAQNIGVWLEDQGRDVQFLGSVDSRGLVLHPDTENYGGVWITQRQYDEAKRQMEKEARELEEWRAEKARQNNGH